METFSQVLEKTGIRQNMSPKNRPAFKKAQTLSVKPKKEAHTTATIKELMRKVELHNRTEKDTSNLLKQSHKDTLVNLYRIYCNCFNTGKDLTEDKEGFRSWINGLASQCKHSDKTLKRHLERLTSTGFIKGYFSSSYGQWSITINKEIVQFKELECG